MQPFDFRDPHVDAYRNWHKCIWKAKTFPHCEEIFCRMATVWLMKYECLVAQKEVEYKKRKERSE